MRFRVNPAVGGDARDRFPVGTRDPQALQRFAMHSYRYDKITNDLPDAKNVRRTRKHNAYSFTDLYGEMAAVQRNVWDNWWQLGSDKMKERREIDALDNMYSRLAVC
ncbi:MAG: hypothetical protein AAFX07_00830 [Pseudomonadota bacterium]